MRAGRYGKARWLAGAGLLLLAGCGGGGGVNSSGSTATSGSATTTTPVIPAINYDDAEYARSNAATDAGAISAWNAGSTGAGVTIAVVDTGLTDATGTEFAGRISSRSTSISDNAGYADQDGHGTAVAAVAAAARNGSDIEGIAFGATIMALRTDTTGSCGTTDGCTFNTNTLASAIDYATQNGAKVINLSLGGSSATTALRNAINRATTAGVVIVLAGGNDATSQPDPLAQIAADPVSRGLVIIAGAHDATGAISSFSDQAGSFGAYYISALGTRVRAFDQTGTDYYYSGTSFSAPAVAAAVALLESAFPKLTAAQVVSLLYSSATDAGAAGVDAVYGHGLLNLAKAFQPAATTSLAGSQEAVSLTSANAVLSSAMGDATMTGSGLSRAVVLDGYGRAFTVDLTGTVARIGMSHPLGNAIGGDVVTRDKLVAGMRVSMTLARDPADEPWTGLAQRGLTGRAQAMPLAGSATMALSRDMAVGFGFAQSGRRIGDLLNGEGDTASFLVARGPDDGPGFDGRDRMAMAVRHGLGGFALDATVEHGALAPLPGQGSVAPGYTLATLRLARRFGPLRLGGGGGVLDEQASVLGARFGAALGGRGARTLLADLDALMDLGHGWRARARLRHGWTDAAAGGALARGRLQSQAASFDIGRATGTVRYGLRYSEPTRVTAGGFALSVPQSYDYDTGAVGYGSAMLNLAPSGRERDVEANLGTRMAGGWIDANLYWRRDPGNIAGPADDRGAALRYGVEF